MRSSKHRPSMAQRNDTGAVLPQRTFSPMQNVSVDRVLRNATEIPSGQPRFPPPPQQHPQQQQQQQQHQQHHHQQPPQTQQQALRQPQPGSIAAQRAAARAAARRSVPADGGVGMAGVVGGPGGRITPQNVPQRTTKVSEKLVLIPDAPDDEDLEDEEVVLEGHDEAARRRLIEQEEDRPLRDVELDVLRKRGGIRGKSYAERLPKRQRAEKVSRLTAYCTAEGFKLKATADFLRTKHEAKTKLYDDCLYVVYHLPLMSGLEGYRVRSRPILKTPGTGKTVLDLEIERSERRDHHYGYVDDYPASDMGGPTEPSTLQPITSNGSDDSSRDLEHSDENRPFSPINRLAPDAKNFAEMFVFSYGVVVFWNFTEHQEKDILGDLNFAESEKGGSLVTRPFDPNDYETEEFHFEYSAEIKHPRIFNDMITLLPRSDHMVKLGISHAVAQSTKLCSFEERMSETMQEALPVPKTMAATGDLNMGRDEIVKVLGRLFKSRVDINLSSNILPVPNFFWESEPTLAPLYTAIRDYLEIDPRIKVLNERCRVFLDLAEILSDTVADAKMSAITWIVIVLIVISIIVTVTEVGLRFGILQKSKTSNGGSGSSGSSSSSSSGLVLEGSVAQGDGGVVVEVFRRGSMEWKLAQANITADELRLWTAGLSESDKGAVCGGDIVGRTYAGV